ncbi:SNARE complex subunit Syn8 [Trichophyton rubrum]|uniref:SNARE complex subunit Syn8 n=1 Tax=Trichophyton rubrum TaxID=5551 RepID=A0A178F224_TRIRU|nr:hypothetical protein HL42_0604 [Trichophyton rubrum]OAL65693.1 SNARE complex subunit Syn8 [Trichophyton rubrum]
MSNPSQLFLLADHIKLSLLERQRAISLDLEPNAQDGEISRSLESLREGLESAEREAQRLVSAGDASSNDFKEQTSSLRTQYEDLSRQFHGDNAPSLSTQPNYEDLAQDFIRASSTPSILKHPTPQHPVSKSVRFTDTLTASAEEHDPNRDALLRPYSDSPQPSFDPSEATNQEIHDYHSQVMQEQDDHLDRLGESIGRQHQLSIQIGDELEGQVALLDDMDGHVERHQGRLDGARRSLGRFREKSKGSKGMMTIIGLIIVLVILIVILK